MFIVLKDSEYLSGSFPAVFPFLCSLKLPFAAFFLGPGGWSLLIPVPGLTPGRIQALPVIRVFILPSLPPGSRPRHPELFGSFLSNDLH